MTTTPKPTENIDPTAWHKRPRGFVGPCPICGAIGTQQGEHRLVAPEENTAAKWIKRKRWRASGKGKSRKGWRYTAVYDPKDRPAITPRVRELCAKAATLFAKGHTYDEIATELDISTTIIVDWRKRHAKVWDFAYNLAMETAVTVARAWAGTDLVLTDPDHYQRMAGQAERWLEQKGEALFSAEGVTLSSFWHDYYLPNCVVDPSPGYLQHADAYLLKWRIFTGDPPLADITNGLLARHRDALAKLRGEKPGTRTTARTVSNHLRFIQRLLDKAGPPGPRNRDAADILTRVPYARPPKVPSKAPKIVAPDVVSLVYTTAGRMDTPKIPGIKPADWWQSLIAVAWNTGLRRGTLFKLRMADIKWEDRCLRIPPERLKANRAEVFHLNPTALAHLERIRGDRLLVWPWPYNPRTFDQRLHYIGDLAGIPRKDQFGLHTLRRSLGTALYRASPAAAQLALGHAAMAVTERHYVQAEGIVADGLDKLEQPAAFIDQGA
ncbi:MAG: tyrosine-type recombinase/integrase [Planctomycetes bacterium]|nr:tyrosine-type recombinase/integrase [Planctomycetota bacterium]